MKTIIPVLAIFCFCIGICNSCNKDSKLEEGNIKNKIENIDNATKNTLNKEISDSNKDVMNQFFVSIKFEESLKKSHSYITASKECGYNIFFINGKHKDIFNSGNELYSLSEEDLNNIEYIESNSIYLKNRGIFKLIDGSFSNERINQYLVENAFSHKFYSDRRNSLSIESNNIIINKEKYSYVLYLGFNQESIDTIRSKNTSYFMDLKDNEVLLYKTNVNDLSFGKRGELVFVLKADEY